MNEKVCSIAMLSTKLKAPVVLQVYKRASDSWHSQIIACR